MERFDRPVRAGARLRQGGLLAGIAALLFNSAGKLAAIALIFGALLWQANRWRASQPNEDAVAKARLQNPSPAAISNFQPANSASPSDISDSAVSNILRLTIVSAESLHPLPDIAVEWRAFTQQGREKRELASGSDGLCLVPVPTNDLIDLQLKTSTEGYASMRLLWHVNRGQKVPENYTLKLARASVISGTVVDASGDPGQSHSRESAARQIRSRLSQPKCNASRVLHPCEFRLGHDPPGRNLRCHSWLEGLDLSVRVVWPEGFSRESAGMVHAMVRTATPNPPAEILGDPARVQQWMQLPENQEAFNNARQFPLAHKEGDRWESSDVPPGDYSLFFFSGGPSRPGEPPPPSIQGDLAITIPKDQAEAAVDVGELKLRLIEP